ncbi:unnamed protein product [Arabis nemorensis]|uniref:Uncharacterized protein n=1 Tax=Arabis nemorensis TaxID=586526 RepID=A0A565AXA2_9BRAS|nr:unnamed protein product [Arabis nemorensis]
MQDGRRKQVMIYNGDGNEQLIFGWRSQAGEDLSSEANVMVATNLLWLWGLGEYCIHKNFK